MAAQLEPDRSPSGHADEQRPTGAFGESLFDDAARGLSSGMSRRRALRLVGASAAMTFAAFSGWLPRSLVRLANARADTCGGSEVDPATQCCLNGSVGFRTPVTGPLASCPNRVAKF